MIKLFQKTLYTPIIILLLFSFGCKKEESLEFKLIPRNDYFRDGYNGISIYRDNNTRKLLNGYYVVGNKETKWEEFSVKEGILNGDYIVYHNNGNVFSQSKYLNGKLHGEEKTYTLSGVLSKVSNYNHGIRIGKDLSYFENGQIRSESKIENEEIIESVTYNIIGDIESQMFIKDGRKITQNISGGKVISEYISSTYDAFEATKFYNEDGSLKIFLQMVEDGDIFYIIERNEAGKEINRINAKTNPQELLKYQQYLGDI